MPAGQRNTGMEERQIYAREDRVGAMFRPTWAALWYLSSLAAWRHGRRRINGDDATAYINHVMRRQWFTAEFPKVAPVTVELVREPASWCNPGRDRVIRIGTSSRRTLQATEWDLLHELAHMVTSARPGKAQARKAGARQRHGDAWTANYILLVENMCGKQAARRLAAAIRPGREP
jgi:hypothetical protein